ncbi:MAG TPA: hypothetical protein DIU07_12530 [Rhodobacteraceae bacterium]|nr:hypothetical protein [Paracoccaceae bacterium]
MTLFSLSAAADALEDHLDHERKMILSGQIDGLLRASGEKQRLLKRLPSASESDEVIQRLRRKAERNQELLLAAARGIKSAARRVDSLRTSSGSLRTYGRDGATADLTNARGGVNRHA